MGIVMIARQSGWPIMDPTGQCRQDRSSTRYSYRQQTPHFGTLNNAVRLSERRVQSKCQVMPAVEAFDSSVSCGDSLAGGYVTLAHAAPAVARSRL
jgi:hypothetical protein